MAGQPTVVSSLVTSTTAARTAGRKAQTLPKYEMALDHNQISNLMQVAQIPSLKMLAQTAGIPRSVLSEYVHGKPGVSAKTVGALAGALHTYPDRIARWLHATN
ncbi:helix-turn-helix DNA binding domain protein [Gordonia phage Kudefre]|uniref:Helix-turn-helix DNA binding domain protein n=2 Tax=Octobienvirus TaxID=3044779 RepID=A0AAE8YAH5_9CAUD|nr:helix-turn-helix DNA binding domain protein [Gordonia phage Kudefre]UDL15276.1 helix-turn-helix DNA binding domain protein [Gordonia phage Kudefre]